MESKERPETSTIIDHKSAIWAASTVYAIEVVHAYGGICSGHEIILQDEWWSNIRLLGFGRKIKNAFAAKTNSA